MSSVKKGMNESQYGGAVIDNAVKGHANDPYVLKKVEKARQMVNKYGLPGDKKK